MTKEIEKPNEITVGIENFFRDVGEGTFLILITYSFWRHIKLN